MPLRDVPADRAGRDPSGGRTTMSDAGLSILGDTAPGFPARQGYGTRAYGNTSPETPLARWLLVRPDGRVTIFAGKVEYGQNIRTGLAVEVADELRMPLSAVDVVLGDTDQTPWDMGTFGSQSTARVGLQLRMAAATARRSEERRVGKGGRARGGQE